MTTYFRYDPTRTLTLRNSFRREMRKRFAKFAKALRKLVEEQDAFGLEKQNTFVSRLMANAVMREYAFDRDDEKIRKFRIWLKKQVGQDILSSDNLQRPWANTYVESAYRKGLVRAYIDRNKLKAVEAGEVFSASKEEFLRLSFAAPETISKLELLYMRTYNDLEGITNHMDTQLSRMLAQGIADGRNPREIARLMVKEISGITRKRAEVLARTEIIHAHAEGQLDSFERLGVETLEVIVEWSTAGDDRVCSRCAELGGKVYKIEEARGIIPLHPNCRCTWIPSSKHKTR